MKKISEFFQRLGMAALTAGLGYWIVSSMEPHDDFGRFLQGIGVVFFFFATIYIFFEGEFFKD
jgi:hypothetical protein